ncbi:MAG TPA: pyruvoyl-dependent arginine decarboxylase [Candidatus Saccharimonadales bacterium]|nr:pyruvoyl-dependent arginine decarboxylase [Candidatus Saccharimonadales bacterium]
MVIQIALGSGKAHTKLAAFDAALHDAGVANYNLIKLSSIIPPGSVVQVKTPISTQPGKWGDRLYVVMADMRVDTPNMEAWAGIGWVQDKKTGRGLFVEHEGTNEKSVRRDIKASLEALQGIRRLDFGDMHMEVIGRTCTHEPVCAIVIAAFQARDWEPSPDFEDV